MWFCGSIWQPYKPHCFQISQGHSIGRIISLFFSGRLRLPSWVPSLKCLTVYVLLLSCQLVYLHSVAFIFCCLKLHPKVSFPANIMNTVSENRVVKVIMRETYLGMLWSRKQRSDQRISSVNQPDKLDTCCKLFEIQLFLTGHRLPVWFYKPKHCQFRHWTTRST